MRITTAPASHPGVLQATHVLSTNLFVRRPTHLRTSASGGSTGNGTVPASAPIPVTDADVPEAHRGLHSFLYGDGDAETAHESATTSQQYSFREGEDDGSALIAVEAYLEARDGERPAGVYAIYDNRRNLQYVSYSRNMVLAVRTIRSRVGEERCAFIRAMVFANRSMQSRATLQREADNWLKDAGTVPPGNGAERDAWEGTESFDTSTMSSAELAEYEEKKVRMLRAMGDKTVELPSVDGDERREKLRAALERDDWSAVVDEQTSLTAQNSARNENSQGAIVTPFARASVHRSVGNVEDPTSMRDMTVESVDAALDDVRPYLMADGGNVEVVSVEGGVVALELQGACGTCPSSSATMKMGIERALRAAFGEQLKEVLSVGGASGPPVATEESVDMHLNMLRGAVAAYGGSVEVDAVESGVATLRYNGPKPIGYGIVAAVKDKFPDLRQIVMLDAETGEPIQF